MLTAILRAGALQGSVLLEAHDEEDEEKHVFEANGASDDELEAEYQEAVALMTIANQRRAEVDLATQFFRKLLVM